MGFGQAPKGMPDNSEVILQDAPIAETSADLLLVKNHYISLDPAIEAGCLTSPTTCHPFRSATRFAPRGRGSSGERCDNIKAGDYVLGWETHSTIPAELRTKVPDDNRFPLHYYINILGAVGHALFCYR